MDTKSRGVRDKIEVSSTIWKPLESELSLNTSWYLKLIITGRQAFGAWENPPSANI